MKHLIVVFSLFLATVAEETIYINSYHERHGIPEAGRIKKAERAQDFDGSRIVGGQTSTLGAHPHFAGLVILLTDGRESVCGSSLLSNTRLVTAAHCWKTDDEQAHSFTVVLGSLRLFSGGVRIDTSDVEIHGSFNATNANNDIAIIRIDHVPYNNNIQRIVIATGTSNYAGSWATAVGFGRTADDIPVTQEQSLKHVSMQVITNAVCRITFGANVVIGSTLCTSTTGGRSTCRGDSGGPLYVGVGSGRRLIGVTSFSSGRGCGLGFPAGFARITSFAYWINARL